MSRLNLSITAQTGREFIPFLRRNLLCAHSLLDKRSTLRELSLAMVGDRRMSELHKQFMGIAKPTDVLTFPIDTDRRGGAISGEVIICVPEARRQARRRKIAVRLEVLLYALHGMLHLLGYDDRTDRAFGLMHRTEDHLLTQLGLGNVFARPAARKVRR